MMSCSRGQPLVVPTLPTRVTNGLQAIIGPSGGVVTPGGRKNRDWPRSMMPVYFSLVEFGQVVCLCLVCGFPDRASRDVLQTTYRQISNISGTKSQKLFFFSSRLAVDFTQSIEARCKVENEDGEQPRQEMPQLHLSDQQLYCLLRCALYQRFDGKPQQPCSKCWGSYRDYSVHASSQ